MRSASLKSKAVKSNAVKSKSIQPKATNQKSSVSNKFPIVGIGASAGGLEALQDFLSHMSPHLEMAFVVVQHLYPKQPSLSAEILSRSTSMLVREAKDGEVVQAGRVYVIPPNRDLYIKSGKLKIESSTQAHGQHMCIDTFFTSLAEDQKQRAIGIVLSGSAKDGTQGCLEIKAKGGVTFAQDPLTAKFPSMPESAIMGRSIDFVLAPEAIARQLSGLSQLPLDDSIEEDMNISPDLKRVFESLKKKTRVDFAEYKPNTVRRRISRRMEFLRLDRLGQYATYLDTHPEEVNALFAEILIHVTSFFRDPEAFEVFSKQILPKYMKARDPSVPFRIWVPGCSTGEEAYSIAIVLLEYFQSLSLVVSINIFATDISELPLQKARLGVYPESIGRDVSKERLKRFFEKVEGGGYRVKKVLRDTCLFSKHDVTNNVPFAKLDLISCRNLLIYFTPELQQKILPIFHYALNPYGILWLGRSETVGGFSNLFNLTEKVNKFYSKKNATAPLRLQFPITTPGLDVGATKRLITNPAVSRMEIQRESDRLAISRYVPPSVVVNDNFEVIHARGHTSPYLELSTGASLNLLKLARPELVADLRLCLQAAMKKGVPIKKEDLTIHEGVKLRHFGMEIIPLPQLSQMKEHYFTVFFEETKLQKAENEATLMKKIGKGRTKSEKAIATRMAAKDQVSLDLQKKLVAAQEYQQAIVEQYETSQEELMSANEELQSTNEEFQSTNEELETAREELQSTNEELSTVNDDLQTRNVEMIQLNHDLNNLLTSIDIPVVMLGPDGRIRRFTPNAGRVLKLIPTDIGRFFGDIQPGIRFLDLDLVVEQVMKDRKTIEIETQDRQGYWYLLQVRPYRGSLDSAEGAVIALLDINALKLGAEEIKVARDDAMTILESAPVPLLVVDSKQMIKMANRSFYDLFKVQVSETEGRFISQLGRGQWNIPKLLEVLQETLKTGQEFHDFDVECEFPEIGHKSMVLNARKIHLGGSGSVVALLAIEDFTERKQIEIREKNALEAAEKANRIKDEFLATLSHELRTPLTSILSWVQLLRSGKLSVEKEKRGLEILEQSARIQGQLINDLLDISRIQSGKLILELQNTNPATSVANALDTIRSLAEEKSIEIKTEIDSTAGNVLGDSFRLNQIFLNLLVNAVKFTPVGGTVVVRSGRVKTASGEGIRVQVKDTGKGIPSKFLNLIFKRFTQVDSSPVRAHGGLGLGLSIVNTLVELHGGTVEAESPGEGMGSTFTVTLPLQVVPRSVFQDGEGAPLLKSPRSPDVKNLELKDRKILLVEDEQNAREVISLLLESHGAEVKTAELASQAIEVLKTFVPDVLVSDIAMPGEDGYSLIRKVRALNSKQSGVPAVALSAYAGSEDIARALAAGFQMHVAKPVDEQKLVNSVVQLLKESLKSK